MPTRPPTRATSQGLAIQEALQRGGGFRSAQDVYAALRAGGRKVGLSTVYRRLQLLADEGVVDVIRTGDGETTYRFCSTPTGGGHHHHVVCRRCGRAEEVEGRGVERWANTVAADLGYVEVEHTVEIFGVCQDCFTAAEELT